MKHLLTYIVLLLAISARAQVSDVVFVGNVTTDDGQQFTYKLQFTDSNGIIKGYSITDVMGPNETKTLITGSINSNQKLIKFRETKVVSSKIKMADKSAYLCYLSGSLKVSTRNNTTVLKGTFKGYKEDGTTSCASGKVMLVSAKDVMALLVKAAKKDSAKKAAQEPAIEKPEPTRHEAISDAEVGKITPGSIKEITVSSATAQLSVWDAKTIDGDKITIAHNGKAILSNYTISGTYKDLTLNLRTNMPDTIKVIAINEGSEPLNTTRIKITSGPTTEYVDATTTIDKPIWIVLKKK